MTTGALSVECADALRRGLGRPEGEVTAEKLRTLATELLSRYSDLSADALFQRARAERDLNDLDGIAARQQELYLQGGFRLFRKANRMYGYAGQADPESAAVLLGALDPLTSPRRGGPRFTRPEDVARAQAIVDDPRTTDRIALDGLVALVKSGSQSVDEAGGLAVPNGDHTLVKVVVTVDRAGKPSSFAEIEATGAVIPFESAEAALCDATWQEVTVDTCDNPLDVGRRQRLFSRRQREALAVRDGGCLWPECTQPPAFTEAHHIEQWMRDHGRTDVGNGILLCRFHHLLLHNNHWEVHRDAGGRHWLTPPSAVDPQQSAILLESKSTLSRHRRREREVGRDWAGEAPVASVALLI